MIPPGFHQYFFSVNGSDYFTNGNQTLSLDEKGAQMIQKKLEKTFNER